MIVSAIAPTRLMPLAHHTLGYYLLDYTLPNGLPPGSRTVWSQIPLQPLVRGPLTPFSYSILAEIASRAWYHYFDVLGFDPMPRARVIRQYRGYPYLNLTISAQRYAEHAGIDPLTLQVDGQPFPVSKPVKPSFLSGIKHAMVQNRVENSLKRLAVGLDGDTAQAKAWYQRILELRWTQAEVLQIMEEIEVVGARNFLAFFAARHHLDLTYNQLLRLASSVGAPANLAFVNRIFDDNTGLIEQALEDKLYSIRQLVVEDKDALSWLSAGFYDDWEERAPGRLSAAMAELLDVYGHRCIDEGEIQNPRWRENPAPLFRQILDMARNPSGQDCHKETNGLQSSNARAASFQQPKQVGAMFLETIESRQRKGAQQLVERAQNLRMMQSRALHMFAYVLAGARCWALAAARDAMTDQRLLAAEDVFFFELEEMKQMMTGEWNVSDRNEIQARCSRRKQEFATWQNPASPAPELLIGEAEARRLASDSQNIPEGISSTWSIGRLFERKTAGA